MNDLYEKFKQKIWDVPLQSLPLHKALWIKFLRIIHLTLLGFTKSQIQQGASSLTYYSLLSIVPVIALLIGIARGFQLEENLKAWLASRFVGQQEVIGQLFTFANASLHQIKQGVIAAIGLVIILWSAMKILMNVEFVLNDIWEVQRSRSIARKFSDFLAMMVIAPLLFFISSSVTLYLSARISALEGQGQVFRDIGPFLFPILNLTPYLLICGLFTFVYIFLPYTDVQFKPALYAGLIAGISYQLLQWIYVRFQIGVVSYNAIYGTFAAIPLFLIWMQLSWMVFLIGAKLAFAFQNVDAYEFVTEDYQLSNRCRSILALRITHAVVHRFIQKQPPYTKKELSKDLSIPLVIVNHILNELIDAKILFEVLPSDHQEPAFQPAFDVDQLTIKTVLDKIDERGQIIPLPPTSSVRSILKHLSEFSNLLEKSEANVPLKKIKFI